MRFSRIYNLLIFNLVSWPVFIHGRKIQQILQDLSPEMQLFCGDYLAKQFP